MATPPRTRRAAATKTVRRKAAPTTRANGSAAKSPRSSILPPVSPKDLPPVSPKDEAAYAETVIATGQGVRVTRGGTLPPDATHEIIEDETGKMTVVRRRFSIT